MIDNESAFIEVYALISVKRKARDVIAYLWPVDVCHDEMKVGDNKSYLALNFISNL